MIEVVESQAPAPIELDSGEPARVRPKKPGEGIVLDPKHKQPGGGVNAVSIAGAQGKKPLRNATICDPHIRTINTHAACGSPDDVYYYAPWRAPGTAPVIGKIVILSRFACCPSR
eukprot:COSAG04_NODE_20169_length_399_cov_0.693333_1_plen_115_part_00